MQVLVLLCTRCSRALCRCHPHAADAYPKHPATCTAAYGLHGTGLLFRKARLSSLCHTAWCLPSPVGPRLSGVSLAQRRASTLGYTNIGARRRPLSRGRGAFDRQPVPSIVSIPEQMFLSKKTPGTTDRGQKLLARFKARLARVGVPQPGRFTKESEEPGFPHPHAITHHLGMQTYQKCIWQYCQIAHR